MTFPLLSDDLADALLVTAQYITEVADSCAPGSSEGRRCFAVFSDVVQFAVCTRRRMLPRCTHPEAQREGVASESPSTLTDVVCTPCTPLLVDVIVTQLGWRSPNSWWSSDRYLIQNPDHQRSGTPRWYPAGNGLVSSVTALASQP